MRTQPKALIYIPIFLLAVMVSFPLQIMVLYSQEPSEWTSILSKLSDLNFLIMFLCPVTAFCVFKASGFTKVLVPVLLCLVGFNNGFVSVVGDDYNEFFSYLATFGMFFAHSSLMDSEIRTLFTYREKRWWLTPPRKQVEVPMLINSAIEQKILRLKTFDISEGGAFIPFNNNSGSAFELKENETMSVSFNLGALTQFRCQAKVVRVAQAKGGYPAGIGVKFNNLGARERKMLKAYVMGNSMDEARADA